MKKMMIVLAALASFSVFANDAAVTTEHATASAAKHGKKMKKVKKEEKKTEAAPAPAAEAPVEAPAAH